MDIYREKNEYEHYNSTETVQEAGQVSKTRDTPEDFTDPQGEK